jgi:hypothetical protein
MTIRLHVHFSYISRHNKLQFIASDDESTRKLRNLGIIADHDGTARPLALDEFSVALPRTSSPDDPDIQSKIGLPCVIHVNPRSYSFISTAKHNRGSRVQGTRLVLENIELLT